MTLKDIINIKQYANFIINGNDVELLADHLKEKEAMTVEAIIGKENNFKGLFYQDTYMQNIFYKFPEILLVDATHKLLGLRMPLYLLLTIDGNGMSEIGAMFMLADETKDFIESTINIFKKYSPKWTDTKVIMSDKDFNEREAFTKLFIDASLVICLYHTLRSFRREITTEKNGYYLMQQRGIDVQSW